MSITLKQALRRIVAQIDDLDADYLVKRKFKGIVHDICRTHGITGVDRGERIYFAKRLLDERVLRTTIKDRLIARYEVSRSQAYRIIDSALQLSHKSSLSETPKGLNVVNEFFRQGTQAK